MLLDRPECTKHNFVSPSIALMVMGHGALLYTGCADSAHMQKHYPLSQVLCADKVSVPSSQVQCLWDNHLDRDYTHTNCNCDPIVMGTGIVNAPCWCCGMVGMDSAENN